MASKCTLCALLAVAFVAPSIALMDLMSCLTMESIEIIMERSNVTIAACEAEIGLSPNNATTAAANAAAATTGRLTQDDAKHPQSILCFMECYWRQIGLVKDGSFVIKEFIKANVKPEHQEKVTSRLQNCFTKEGLSSNYTLNKEDQCKSLEKYDKCMHEVAKVCIVDDDSSSSEED